MEIAWARRGTAKAYKLDQTPPEQQIQAVAPFKFPHLVTMKKGIFNIQLI